jgi:DNA-binding transcriptional regulator LsrR (DeoR family)
MENVDHLRLVVKVARLYHTHGRRQSDIAARLQVSQSRVSRLLAQAEEAGIVRTVVTARPEIHSELEEQVEERYGLQEVHVFDAVSADDAEFTRDLAHAMAAVLEQTQLKAPTIGFTSWSRTQRQMVEAVQPLRTRTERVVEMLGDLGPPDVQHAAARSTQVFAGLLDAEPVFLRTPGVVPTPAIKELLLSQDSYVSEALALLDDLDLALVGIGSAEIYSPLRAGENYFTEQQLTDVRAAGAVGQVCLRFLDADGGLIQSPLDDMVVGVTPDQLRSARRRWAVAGGPSKYLIIRAALRGGWVDSLVTDAATARFLLSSYTGPTGTVDRPRSTVGRSEGGHDGRGRHLNAATPRVG